MSEKCDICGSRAELVDGLVKADTDSLGAVRICKLCAQAFYTHFLEEDSPAASLHVIHPHRHSKNTPSQIVDHLNDYVIGQDSAKRDIAVAVFNHYKRIHTRTSTNVEIDKANILMIGPTGSGKTLLLQSLAKMLDVPFTIGDATLLTKSGYVGMDCDSLVQNLLIAANGDVEKAQRGIIFIDEIDKLAKVPGGGPNSSEDPGCIAVQQELLKMLEGSDIKVPKGSANKRASHDLELVNTRDILFVVGGAFVGLDKIVERRVSQAAGGTGFGFSAKVDKLDVTFSKEEIETEDILEFGLIPEFLGRIPVICRLHELDQTTLEHILTEPKNAITKQYEAMLAMDGVKLKFTKSAISRIAEDAIKKKTGARGLRSTVERLLKDTMFMAPEGKIASATVEVKRNKLHVTTAKADLKVTR